MDELEYLLDELVVKDAKDISPARLAVICGSLDDLIDRTCRGRDAHSNSFFGLQLKSHGVLLKIFESLAPEGKLVGGEGVHLRLLILIAHLLPDVRRLDFFVPSEVALTLAAFLFKAIPASVENADHWKLLQKSPIFANSGLKEGKGYAPFLALWMLTKLSLATLHAPVGFSESLCADEYLMARLIDACFAPFPEVIRDRSGALLDALCTVSDGDVITWPESLIERLLEEARSRSSLSLFKFAVSLTGSNEGVTFLARSSPKAAYNLLSSLLSVEDADLKPLALSCLVNLLDRAPESVIDTLRFKIANDKTSIIHKMAAMFTGDWTNLLLSLALTFSTHQNRTNAEVIKAAWPEESRGQLLASLRSLVQTFLTEQSKPQPVKRAKLDSSEREGILSRLSQSIFNFQ